MAMNNRPPFESHILALRPHQISDLLAILLGLLGDLCSPVTRTRSSWSSYAPNLGPVAVKIDDFVHQQARDVMLQTLH